MPGRRTRHAPHAPRTPQRTSHILHKIGFLPPGARVPQKIGADAYALTVTPAALNGLHRLANTMLQGTVRQWTQSDPALKSRLCILVHFAPKNIDEQGWKMFHTSHTVRVSKQNNMATNPGTQACSTESVAAPIVSGGVRVGARLAYVACVEIDPRAVVVTPQARIIGSTTTTNMRMRNNTLGPMEYAAIEKAIVMSWKAGIEHTRMGPVMLNRATLHATLTDFSGIVALPKWKYNMARSNNYVKVLGPALSSETADAVFLRKLYGLLQPVSDPAGRAALVDKARQGIWKCAESMS
jgi:hypothetical protein